MHHSYLSERKYLETASADGMTCAITPAAEVTSSLLLKTQLEYEQFINRLGQRLSGLVTEYLKETTTLQDGEMPAIDSEILQVVTQELSQILVTETIAVLQRREGDRHQEEASSFSKELTHSTQADSSVCNESPPTNGPSDEAFTIQHLVLRTPLKSKRKCSWTLATGKSLRFAVGETLNWKELQDLKLKAPMSVWQIGDAQTVWGWLLIHPGDAPSEADGQSPEDRLKTYLIEQSIHQCVMALQQVKLIQVHYQQRQKLLARNQELVQTNRLKSEFLANTSHEIRTPLSSILGFTHLLQAQGFSPTNLRHQEYLNIILTSGQHLLSLLNDILDLSKIEANQLDLQWETVEVRSLCQMAMTLVKEKVADRGLEMRLKIAPEVTSLTADGLRLKQMLFNLLSNAIKFTLRGSIGIEVSSANGFLRFTVWDTGTGISQEQQRLLFRPYSQLANAATGRGEGTGLGLALTQKLAELHGGWVEVWSKIDHGSRFTIVLPLTPPSLPRKPVDLSGVLTSSVEEVPSPQPRFTSWAPVAARSRTKLTHQGNSPDDFRSTNRSKKKSYRPAVNTASGAKLSDEAEPPVVLIPRPNHLMLVEDNVHNAKLMLTFLSKSGYEVTWVQDGREMWQALERSLPALILMDIHLPEVDGLTLTHQLKCDDRYQSIPVIAQTAMAMKGDRDLCLEAGAVDYISKPIDLDVLGQMVKRYITNS
ncbi:ATP-binding protein [Leptothermofonsia sp. ETS-13]|uniref:ATP-binding protein n=1 Tax=Leptothermofonsia sp. ETS-13 TaxID=3035696 RepID=UPI003BA08239